MMLAAWFPQMEVVEIWIDVTLWKYTWGIFLFLFS